MTYTLPRSQPIEGGHIHLNKTHDFQCLRVPSRAEMRDLLQEFRSLQWQWLTEWLCQANDDGTSIQGLAWSLVKAPAGSRVKNPDWRSLNLVRIAADNVPAEAWDVLRDVESLPGSSYSTRLVNASLPVQREFMLAALGKDLEAAEALFRPHLREPYVHSWIDQAHDRAGSTAEFLTKMFERSAFERRPMSKEERSSNFLRSPIVDLFLLWLWRHGVILFPMRTLLVTGDPRSFEDRLFGDDVKALWALVQAAYADVAAKRNALWAKHLRTLVDNLVMSSTMRSTDDMSLELFQSAYEVMDERMGEILADKLHLVYRALRDSSGRRDLPTFKPRRSTLPTKDTRLDWVRHSTGAAPRSIFPQALKGEYAPLQHMCAWADRLSRLLPKLPLKNVGNALAAYQHLLVWMIEAGVTCPTLDGITREHVNDARPLASSQCLRAYMSRAGTTTEYANVVLQRLAAAFDAIIEEDELRVANPILLRFDSFKIPVSRGKTLRRPMGRDLMTYLREVNRRDDFALSRSYKPHQRSILDVDTGRYVDRWFPAYGVLVDLLLQLPLRGFQARFLDSGEGDESVVKPGDEGVQTLRSIAPNARKGRRQGVFYAFDAKDGRPALGIHVNTNKTAVDRASGYEIPWCSKDLRENLSMMIRWQAENNPVVTEIPCMERPDFEQVQNLEVLDAIQRTYPLFRDPADPAGWPVNRDKLFDYWSMLLAAAEDELSTSGKPVSLTVEREVSKGPGKKPVLKRLAAFDIHTLRVSGISALIEAGLPPDMVQDVAGHATIVMTLYYNKIKASRLNHALGEALDNLTVDLDGIDGMAEADYARLSEFLVNTRVAEDAVGQTLLTERMGCGDGSVQVMVHGICPGGECSSGGEFANQAVGYMPVPRPLACSLCRYRLTGPMFLPGLVLNANRLMHELRRKGVQIAGLNEERERLEDEGKPTQSVKARIDALYRETDVIATEWGAEVQYVHMAEAMFERYAASSGKVEDRSQALVTPLGRGELETKIEPRSEFALLQTLAEGSSVWSGFRPSTALDDHREFLNETLVANDVEPFLLRLRGEVRDKAAVLLGQAISRLVPDDRIGSLRTGDERLADYPEICGFLTRIREQAAIGRFEEGTLSLSDMYIEEV